MLSSIRRPPPQVTGISPNEGPPGSKVTIRGENLGVDSKDLISLRICANDCLLSAEWKSPNKIIARTGQAKGRGDIIVVTRSGGVGSCTVQFRGFFIQIGRLEPSAVWVDENQTVLGRSRGMSPLIDDDYDDPLGICDESNERKYPEKELTEMFNDASGLTSKENFNPAWFLLENHHKTSFADLKAGLAHLKSKSTQRSEGPLAFVKANLSTFMDCQDTLAAMHDKLVVDQESAPGGSLTKALEDILYKSNASAEALFMDVLKRKERADATRNALSVLHRFKFLFNLPCSIDKNITKGDYDLAITDFTRAKSLFGETDVPIFKKVYQEVEDRVSRFQKKLKQKLMVLPSSVDEQKRLIRYLVHLEAQGDPAWDCLVNMQQWILGLLYQCCEKYSKKEKELEKTEYLKKENSKVIIINTSNKEENKPGSKTPQKVLFVDQLTRDLQEHLPDFWRLGQTYISGKLLKETKDQKARVGSTKPTELKNMVLEIIRVFSFLLRSAFLPSSLNHLSPMERVKYGSWTTTHQDSPIAWLPICVRNIRSCLISLYTMELPGDSTEVLEDLAFDVRIICIDTLLKQAIKDIHNLYNRESWIVDSHDEHGGTTSLPSSFENIVSETVQHLQDVIVSKPKERELFLDSGVQKRICSLCIEMLQSFTITVNRLAIEGNNQTTTTTPADEKTITTTSTTGAGRNSVIAVDYQSNSTESMPSLDERLMIMLSSCCHTVEHVVPRIIELLEVHQYPLIIRIKQESFKSYVELDNDLFDRYIEEKTNPIIGIIEQSMYEGGYDWKHVTHVNGVRFYIKDIIMRMIDVHAQVYSITPQQVHRVMTHISESVIDELCRLYLCVQTFNHYGTIQAHLDLSAIEVALLPFNSEKIRQYTDEARSGFPKLTKNDDITFVKDQVNIFQQKMAFHLTCFKTSENGVK